MIIRRFAATGVHGHLDLTVRFNRDLTFLTGINGSGKTSVVKGIDALLSPSLALLALMDYEHMEVDVTVDKRRKIQIWSTRSENHVAVGCSEVQPILEYLALPPEPREVGISARAYERTSERYRELEAKNANHPVMRAIRDLPTPMILGIERRYSDLPQSTDDLYQYRAFRRSRVYSSNPYASGLYQASETAELATRRIQAQERELTDALRKNILLSAFQYTPVDLSLPAQAALSRRIEITEQTVLKTFEKLGLSGEAVQRAMGSFFEKLRDVTEILQGERDMNKLLAGDDPKKREAITEWIINAPQFNRITRILGYIETYVRESSRVNEPIHRYLEIINEFLRDSHKRVAFDDTGQLQVQLEDGAFVQLTSLSSGESQLLIIITHLALNPAAQLANIFIVDEPELSLHVRWQELFVEALQRASPQLQLILATHSPSIILDRDIKCVDLSKRRA